MFVREVVHERNTTDNEVEKQYEKHSTFESFVILYFS